MICMKTITCPCPSFCLFSNATKSVELTFPQWHNNMSYPGYMSITQYTHAHKKGCACAKHDMYGLHAKKAGSLKHCLSVTNNFVSLLWHLHWNNIEIKRLRYISCEYYCSWTAINTVKVHVIWNYYHVSPFRL